MTYGMGRTTARIAEVMSVICAGERVTVADLKSASRRRALARPRQYAMALCRELTGQSYPQIGRMFGGRDHTTALHAVRKVATLAECSPPLARKLDDYRQQIAALVTDRLAALGGCSSAWAPQPQAEMAILRPTVTTVTMEMAA